MSNEEALLDCTFGWGQTCYLYQDSIDIAGKFYDLRDLTSIYPSYRVVLGVPSARLELSFGLQRLVLRGIADLDSARLMVSHMQPYCATSQHAAHRHSRASRSRSLARAQAKAWERTNVLPAVIIARTEPLVSSASGQLKESSALKHDAGFEETLPTNTGISLEVVPKAPLENTSLSASETLEAFVQLASNLSTYISPLAAEIEQPPHTPRFQPPLHSVHLIPPEQKFDSDSLPVPAIKNTVLPIIPAPVRLPQGEYAHYSVSASLCSDRISNSARPVYPQLDQGLLILTNRRVLYRGKRSQFTLAYTHLWYVSLLHTALALHIEGQFRRIIIELEHPEEWASRIEQLAFIARRARPEPPTIAIAALAGSNTKTRQAAARSLGMKNALTLDIATVPLLTEQAASKMVDVETIDLHASGLHTCVNLGGGQVGPVNEGLELVKSNTPRSDKSPESASLPEHASPNRSKIADVPTQAMGQSDIATLATREFEPQPDLADAPTQAMGQSDIATLATREFEPQPDLADAPTQAMGQSAIARAELPAPQYADEDEDDRTIHLHNRKLCQLRTVAILKAEPERPPDSQTTDKRLPRVRGRRARR